MEVAIILRVFDVEQQHPGHVLAMCSFGFLVPSILYHSLCIDRLYWWVPSQLFLFLISRWEGPKFVDLLTDSSEV